MADVNREFGAGMGRHYAKKAIDNAISGLAVISTSADNQFGSVTEKAAPIGADRILIEDSAAAFAKKYAELANLPARDLTITTVTATSYTVDADDDIILIDDDTAGGVVTVTLLPSAGAPAKRVDFKKIGSTANVILDGDGSETIDGGLTATFTSQYEGFTLAPDGVSGYYIVG